MSINPQRNEMFKVDGQTLSTSQLKDYFKASNLGKRQIKTLNMISGKAKSILDLGCYSGHVVAEAIQLYPEKQVIGADYDEEHLRIARTLHPHLPPSTFQILSAYDLSNIKHKFDTILFQEVIEHLEGAAQAIKEINRALKIGGELILSTPTPYYWRDMWQCFKYELIRRFYKRDLPLSDVIYFQQEEWNRHIYCWTPSTLYTLLKVNGFDYGAHDYCQDGQGFIEKQFLKLFPFFSPTIIIKVKKVAEASTKLT